MLSILFYKMQYRSIKCITDNEARKTNKMCALELKGIFQKIC